MFQGAPVIMAKAAQGPRIRRIWPWLVLALATLPAIWYVVDFESDIDPEYPLVARLTFNTYPPAAYRFAEPGDTIDHIAVYVAAAAIVLSGWGVFQGARQRLWHSAMALSLAGYWHASTPGPLLDGWHGLGWRTILNPAVPWAIRLVLAATAVCLLVIILWGSGAWPIGALWVEGAQRSCRFDQRGCGSDPGAPVRLGRPRAARLLAAVDLCLGFAGLGIGLAASSSPGAGSLVPEGDRRGSGVALAWPGFHWPGDLVAPASAPSSARGRPWAHLSQRHAHLPGTRASPGAASFPDDRQPFSRGHVWPQLPLARRDSLRRERGLNYIGNEQGDDPSGEAFIAQTLALAQDRSAWPILVHCHASMDRSPAWMGLYRVVVQGWPLADALREIERHRGLRPKASVTLLYNRVLPWLAPERSALDPTVPVLRQCAAGTVDPLSGSISSPTFKTRQDSQALKASPVERR